MEIINGTLNNVEEEDLDKNGRFICPEGIERISRYAFRSVRNCVKHISLPNSVKKIEEETFCECYDLVSLNIPEGTESIKICDFSVDYEESKGVRICHGTNTTNWQNLELPRGIKVKSISGRVRSLSEGLLVVNIENLEKMIENNQYVQNKPVILNIKNVSELPIEKLNELNRKCKIQAIQIIDGKSQGRYSHQTRYPYDVETYKKCREEIDKILSKIDIKEYKEQSDCEKIIFGKVIRELAHITYDKEAFRKGVRFVSCRNLEGGLLNRTCVCVGYAEIIRNILACYGIEAKLIECGGHCWNQVKLDGEWYNIDFTYDQPRILRGKSPKYLLKSDKDFKKHSKKLLDFKKQRDRIQYSVYLPSEYKEFDVETCEKTVPQDRLLRYIYDEELITEENNVTTTGYYVPQQILSKNTGINRNIVDYIKNKRICLSEIISTGKRYLERVRLKKKDADKGEGNEL